MTPAAAQRWATNASYVDQSARHAAPTVALLHHDDAAEDDLVAFDEGSARAIAPCERAGLTPAGDGRERVVKYGSVIAARTRVAALR